MDRISTILNELGNHEDMKVRAAAFQLAVNRQSVLGLAEAVAMMFESGLWGTTRGGHATFEAPHDEAQAAFTALKRWLDESR